MGDLIHTAALRPAWINMYYVMDLAPRRSFIEWAVQHERTVFAISYRKPQAVMSGITMDDYLIHRPRQALDVIQQITDQAAVGTGALRAEQRRPYRPGEYIHT